MTDDIRIPTRDEVLLDLRSRLEADARRLLTLWGNERVHSLLGKPAPPNPGLAGVSLFRQPWEFRGEDIDLASNPAGQLALAMYAYAFEFRHPISMTPHVFSNEIESLEDFVNSFQSDLFDLFLADTPSRDVNDGALLALCQHTRARLSLDLGEPVSIRELALLARMSERSVRNAVSTGPADQRLTVSHDLVKNADARRWLSGRREYVPTHFTNITVIPGEHPEQITTLIDLGRYIDARWAGLGKTPESVADELGWSDSRLQYLRAITSDPHVLEPHDCEPLAKSLLVSSVWFTEQVMRVLFPHQMALILASRPAASEAQEAPKADPVITEKLDVSTRLVFVLHDGTRLYPAKMKNRESKKVAFRLSAGGAGGNTLEAGLEIDSEDEMIDMVVHKDYAVRMTSERGGMKSLYKRNGRSIQAAYLDGQLVESDA